MRLMKRKGQEVYLDGFLLLSLCQKLVRLAIESQPAGTGSPENPYVLANASQWIWLWRKSANNTDSYLKISGRLIRKNAKLYVGDIGPAYLKGSTIEDSADKSRARFLKDTVPDENRIRLGRPVANVNEEQKLAWIRRNTDDDPTYRSGADRVQRPGKIFAESTRKLEIYGHEVAPWNTVVKSVSLAKSVRRMLKAQSLPGFGQEGFSRDYSRVQTMFPVFTAAVFLAEPARNERAWPINLMVLDLAERGVNRYTWDAIMWHPQGVDLSNLRPASFGPGPSGPKAEERNIVENVTDPEKLHLIGGMLPASPTSGGERGKPALYKDAKPLHPKAIERGQVQSPGQILNVRYDFIHQKEINVLLEWLMTKPTVASQWEILNRSAYEGTVEVPKGATLRTSNDVFNGTGDVAAIKTAIQNRISSLD